MFTVSTEKLINYNVYYNNFTIFQYCNKTKTIWNIRLHKTGIINTEHIIETIVLLQS